MPSPVAATVKAADLPFTTVAFFGCAVMVGLATVVIVSVAELEVTFPSWLDTTQRYLQPLLVEDPLTVREEEVAPEKSV